MKLLEKILERWNGLQYPQEYLCFAKESFQQPLHIYLLKNDVVQDDVTNLHAFVGYCPLVFVLPRLQKMDNEILLVFSHTGLAVGERINNSARVAILSMRLLQTQTTAEGELAYYKAFYGRHKFTSPFSQAMAQWQNKLYNRKAGNVYLEGNLFEQVQVAYALPRKICLITVGADKLYNLFPTDLHGQVRHGYYVISLRFAGKACEQVLANRRIVLSDIQASSFKAVYGLGKNHMQPMKEHSSFDFSSSFSAEFGLPLPNGAVSYKELALMESFTEGIHRLLLFRIVNDVHLTSHPQTLVHIHRTYAGWRLKQGLPGNYLLR